MDKYKLSINTSILVYTHNLLYGLLNNTFTLNINYFTILMLTINYYVFFYIRRNNKIITYNSNNKIIFKKIILLFIKLYI